MKVIMLNNMSANGMICRDDRTEDFLSSEGGQYLIDQAKKYGNIIWGRQAYENVIQNLPRYDVALANLHRIVVSSNPNFKTIKGYQGASSPKAALSLLDKLGVRTALLDGGRSINTSFLNEGLVDEVHFIAEPVLVGSGLSSITSDAKDVKLSLMSVEKVHNGEVLLKYRVIK